MKTIAILFIRFYQRILSPVLNSVLHSVFGFHFRCKYEVSCSQYTVQQIEKHGTIAGLFLGFKRIISCWELGHQYA